MRVFSTCPGCQEEVSYIQRAYLFVGTDREPERCPKCGVVVYDYQEAEAERAARQAEREARGDTSLGELFLYAVAIEPPAPRFAVKLSFGSAPVESIASTQIRVTLFNQCRVAVPVDVPTPGARWGQES